MHLHMSKGIHDLGPIDWKIAGSVLFVFMSMYFSLWKGVKGSGKVNSFLFRPIRHAFQDESEELRKN